MAGNGISASIDIDFRPYVNRMRYYGEQINKSVTSPSVREQILQELVGDLVDENYGQDTGATHYSIQAVATGDYISDKAFSNDKGITRYGTGRLISNSRETRLEIDPVDENGRHYGAYSVNTELLSTYAQRYELYDEDNAVSDIIMDAVRHVIGG